MLAYQMLAYQMLAYQMLVPELSMRPRSCYNDLMQTPEDLPGNPTKDTPKITRRTLLLAVPALLLAGCAKAPSGGITSPSSGPQLLVTMTVAGKINSSYYYYILFNVNNTPSAGNSATTGPVPVVAPPYVNGFAAGAFTNYVEYNQGVPGGTSFGFYSIDAALRQPNYLGSSGYLVTSKVSGGTLSFQLPLAFLATSTIPVDQIQTLQVNFITTNAVQVVGNDFSTPKYFDALSTPDIAGNSFVNIFVRNTLGGPIQQLNYLNTDRNIEGSGDVAQFVNGVPIIVSGVQNGVTIADLDIIDFTIRLNL